MNDNKQVTSVTVRTVGQSDFKVPEGQTDLGKRGVVVHEEDTRNFIPFSNVASIEYHLEEVESQSESDWLFRFGADESWSEVAVQEFLGEAEDRGFDLSSGSPGSFENEEVSEDETNEEEPITVTQSFSQSIDEDSLEEDYTVDELSNVILPHIEDSAVLNDAIEVDGRSTAVDEYEDRLEDLRDEGQ